MSRFTEKTEIPRKEFPHWPEHCNCGKQTLLAVMVVYDDRGQLHHGAFTDFATTNREGKRRLRDPYTFARWDAFCEDHTPASQHFTEMIDAKIQAEGLARDSTESPQVYQARMAQTMRHNAARLLSKGKRRA